MSNDWHRRMARVVGNTRFGFANNVEGASEGQHRDWLRLNAPSEFAKLPPWKAPRGTNPWLRPVADWTWSGRPLGADWRIRDAHAMASAWQPVAIGAVILHDCVLCGVCGRLRCYGEDCAFDRNHISWRRGEEVFRPNMHTRAPMDDGTFLVRDPPPCALCATEVRGVARGWVQRVVSYIRPQGGVIVGREGREYMVMLCAACGEARRAIELLAGAT